jgi:hypothetical protein
VRGLLPWTLIFDVDRPPLVAVDPVVLPGRDAADVERAAELAAGEGLLEA